MPLFPNTDTLGIKILKQYNKSNALNVSKNKKFNKNKNTIYTCNMKLAGARIIKLWYLYPGNKT